MSVAAHEREVSVLCSVEVISSLCMVVNEAVDGLPVPSVENHWTSIETLPAIRQRRAATLFRVVNGVVHGRVHGNNTPPSVCTYDSIMTGKSGMLRFIFG